MRRKNSEVDFLLGGVWSLEQLEIVHVLANFVILLITRKILE